MTEEWRPIVGYEDTHEVSNLGRVRSIDRVINLNRCGRHDPALRKGIILKQDLNAEGYASVRISRKSKTKRLSIHVLVTAAFLGPRPNGFQIAHWDNDRSNSKLGNLRYATPADNNADKKRHGTQFYGEDCNNSKLSTNSVLEIRRRASFESRDSLAIEFGIHPKHVGKIVRRKIWTHLP